MGGYYPPIYAVNAKTKSSCAIKPKQNHYKKD